MVDTVRALLPVEDLEICDICKKYFKIILEDVNWRVRGRLFDNIIEMAKLASPSFAGNDLLEGILLGLVDRESTIKSKVVNLIPQFAMLCPDKEIMRKSITYDLLQKLLLDDSPDVREAISRVIVEIITKMTDDTKTVRVSGTLVGELSIKDKDLIFIILRKLCSDHAEKVRINFCMSLSNAYALCGAKSFAADI